MILTVSFRLESVKTRCLSCLLLGSRQNIKHLSEHCSSSADAHREQRALQSLDRLIETGRPLRCAACQIDQQAARRVSGRGEEQVAQRRKGLRFGRVHNGAQRLDEVLLRGRLTELWISVEDYDMAESALRDWTNAPEATRKRVLAAALFHRDQKKDKAVALLEGYLAGHAEDVEITRQLAGYLDKMGSNKELVDLLDKAPGSEQEADLLLLRAVARRKLQDFPGAVRDFAAADKLSPEDSGIAANRPSFDRLRAALAGIEAANTLLARNPGDLRARLARSYWYLTTGSAGDLALEDARQAREADPGSVTALLLFAMASNQAGKLSAAQALETLQVDTSKPLPTPETLDRFQRCDARIAQQPKEVSLLLERGRELADNAQQYRLAARDAEAVLEINPRNVSARAAKIREFAKLGRSDDAAIELRVLETQNPPRGVLAGSLSEMADASFAASRLDAALEYVNRAIKLKPEAHYYKQRAAILQRLERFSEATSDLALARQTEKDGDR